MPRATPPIQIVLAARDLIAGHEHANQAVMRLLVDQLATHRGLPIPDWPSLPSPVDTDDLDKARRHLADLDMTEWDINDIGAAYERMTGHADAAWYTPPEIAEFMVRFSIGPQLDRLSEHPDPGNVLQVLATDPSCGAGVFLVTAARFIAARYSDRLFGETTDLTMQIVMPEVMSETIFGIDIDPGAVELAKAALWLEVGGEQSITFMDRNVICGNTLAGPHVQPPKLAERLAETSASATTDPATAP